MLFCRGVQREFCAWPLFLLGSVALFFLIHFVLVWFAFLSAPPGSLWPSRRRRAVPFFAPPVNGRPFCLASSLFFAGGIGDFPILFALLALWEGALISLLSPTSHMIDPVFPDPPPFPLAVGANPTISLPRLSSPTHSIPFFPPSPRCSCPRPSYDDFFRYRPQSPAPIFFFFFGAGIPPPFVDT